MGGTDQYVMKEAPEEIGSSNRTIHLKIERQEYEFSEAPVKNIDKEGIKYLGNILWKSVIEYSENIFIDKDLGTIVRKHSSVLLVWRYMKCLQWPEIVNP